MKIELFNGGYVELLHQYGTELDVINVAKVSFDNTVKEWQTPSMDKLFNYLWHHGHTSPFRHIFLSFRVHAPISIVRQWEKYRVGSPIDTPSNEVSGRYVELKEEFFIPSEWRLQSKSNKQGSFGKLNDELQEQIDDKTTEHYKHCHDYYEELLSSGVAKEQARFVLPNGLYTTFIWTPSLQALMHFLEQRLSHDAQKELQDYAKAVFEITKTIHPRSMEVLLDKILPKHHHVMTIQEESVEQLGLKPILYEGYQLYIEKTELEKMGKYETNQISHIIYKITKDNIAAYCLGKDLNRFKELGWKLFEI